MSGWVTVTGPPSAICWRKMGTTLPRLPSTLPKRTETNGRPHAARAASVTTSSATRLVQPMTLAGLTALSVEMSTKRSTPMAGGQLDHVARAERRCCVTASSALPSISGTCLCAAA